MTPKQVLQMIKDKGVVMVDIKFIDLLGTWQHFATPISEFKDESPFDEGLGFDGSSIRGWQSIERRRPGSEYQPNLDDWQSPTTGVPHQQ